MEAYLPLIPKGDVFLGGWSFGGALALMIARARLDRGLPVKGVVLIDSFNSEGWSLMDDSSPRFLANSDQQAALSATDFSALHQAHADTLLVGGYHQSSCPDTPVLLIRADNTLHDDNTFVVPGYEVSEQHRKNDGVSLRRGKELSPMMRNFWSPERFGTFDVLTVPNVGHWDLLTPGGTVVLVSEAIEKWCDLVVEAP